MASGYTRPELTKADLRAFQVARCVVVNPDRTDVLKALTTAEKGCKRNRLSQDAALSAYDQFVSGNLQSVFIGDYECEARMRYPLQGTVLQVVRMTDNLTGLICDRQQIQPGCHSRPPINLGAEGLCSGRSPGTKLKQLLVYFWPFLSDADLDEIHNTIAVYVMCTLVSARKEAEARQQAELLQRKSALETLCKGVKPTYTSQFVQACTAIASDVAGQGASEIRWRDIKRRYPAAASRFKTHFLAMLVNGSVSVELLRLATNKTDFDIRLTTWQGEMRIFNVPQLVMQVRNIPIHHRFKAGSLWHSELSEFIKAEAKKSCHPSTENTVGWLRIHIDDENKLCFVDEVQSDAMELALTHSKNPRYELAAKEFLRDCSSWHLDAFATVFQWAQDIGYRPAIHSRQSAIDKEYMTRSERKWVTYYGTIVKQFGLQEVELQGYPGKIWVAEHADSAIALNTDMRGAGN